MYVDRVAEVEGRAGPSLRAVLLNAQPLSTKCRGEGAFCVSVTAIASVSGELTPQGRSCERPH